MRISMVNDCAYVGETILKYLPQDLETVHVRRGRNLLDKTFGLAYRILRARGDIYHVHYLLQDCYLTLKLGKKPVIGHAHGSDLRRSLNHPVWGRVVRHNLRECDKVLVSTPDILSVATAFSDDAEYFPNPVDTERFHPEPFRARDDKLRVFLACDSNWEVKGVDKAIRALGKLKNDVEASIIGYGKDFSRSLRLARSLSLEMSVLPVTSHRNMREYYWNADLVIGSIGVGGLGMVVLEAIACGRPTITYVSSNYREYADFPLKDIKTADGIASTAAMNLHNLWKAEYEYFCKHHEPRQTLKRLCEIYASLY